MFLETADIETATEDYAHRFSGPAGQYFLEKQTNISLSLLQDLPGAKVLDVGGGHAQLAKPLVENGFEVTVTGSADSCRTRLDKCLSPSCFNYLTCDSLNLPFNDRTFDVVFSYRLLPHVVRWQTLITELCRVAKHAVIVDYPDRRSSNIMYEQFFAMKRRIEGNTRPFTLFSRSQIAVEFTRNNFEIPTFKPEFILPMVVHRKVKNRIISKAIEDFFSLIGLTGYLGSPIILRSNRKIRALGTTSNYDSRSFN